jgi:nicotinamide phosphoribosyltransferase
MRINPLLQTDFYKVNHYNMYPKSTTKIYSNLTPRKSRVSGINKIVVFGIQAFILDTLIEQWRDNFFLRRESITEYKRMMDATLGKDAVKIDHIEDLWDLGYLPLHIKALPEGLK